MLRICNIHFILEVKRGKLINRLRILDSIKAIPK